MYLHCVWPLWLFWFTDYIRGQEHVPKSRDNNVTRSKLGNNSCPMYNCVLIVLCQAVPLVLSGHKLDFKLLQKNAIPIFCFSPHDVTSTVRARTSYNLLPGIVKDRYWCDRFYWLLLLQKTCTFHILCFETMSRGRKQIRDIQWPDSW